MSSYSVAIRTLGYSVQIERELRDVFAQSIKPQKVILCLPEGYHRPDFQVANEEYVWVKKGMAAQRILPYNDITSDYILMLDDDVSLQTNSVEKLIGAMEKYDLALVGADTFRTHKLSLHHKVFAAISNLTFPNFSKKWAFKINKNGSFSYIVFPQKDFYYSQSCAGNAMLWKRDFYLKLHLEDELWLDELPFAYGDDMLESYKVYKNKMKLGVVFNSGIKHLDMKTASDAFRKRPDYIRYRTMAQFVVWWRAIYNSGNLTRFGRYEVAFFFISKLFWMLLLVFLMSLYKFSFSYLKEYLNGLTDGWRFVHLDKFKLLRPYVLKTS